MEKTRIKTRATVLILLVGMSAAIALTGDVVYDDTIGVRPALPAKVGDFTGVDIYYCQDGECSRSRTPVEAGSGGIPSKCEKCGGPMGMVAPVERAILPADTVIAKKRYGKPGGVTLAASMVISGRDRISIHRPQNCLPAAGFRMGAVGSLDVPLAERRSVRLRTIDLQAGDSPDNCQGYAYWYTDGKRETSLQSVMMLWIVYDRAVRNKATRWAYIAIQVPRIPGTDDHLQAISELVSALYPQVIPE